MSNSDNARRGSLPDVKFTTGGSGHGSMHRNCHGKACNCGPRSAIGSTRPDGRFFCAECSAKRAERAARVA